MPTLPTAEAIRKAIRAVKDPELNLNIIDIGLVYEVDVRQVKQTHFLPFPTLLKMIHHG